MEGSESAVSRRHDWSEHVFQLAFSLWHSWRMARPFASTNSLPPETPATTTATQGTAKRPASLCSCPCHCQLRKDHLSSDFVAPGGERLNSNKKRASSVTRRSKSRHSSSDHVKCIKIVHNTRCEFLSPTSRVLFGSVGHEKSPCSECRCRDGRILDTVSKSAEEVHDQSFGKAMRLKPVCIRQCSSDPGLSSTASSPNIQNSINENTYISENTCISGNTCISENTYSAVQCRRAVAGGSLSNSSSFAVPPKTEDGTRQLKTKRYLSFRLSTRSLAKKFTSSKVHETTHHAPTGTLKLSAINDLNNKPIDELRAQLEGKMIKTHAFSLTSINDLMNSNYNAKCLKNSNNNNIGKNTSNKSLRLRRRSTLLRSGAARSKVQPVECSSGAGDGGSHAPHYSAWTEEYDGLYEDLHHASCPCRQQLSNNKVTPDRGPAP